MFKAYIITEIRSNIRTRRCIYKYIGHNCFITNCTYHALLKIPNGHSSYRKRIKIMVSGSVTNRCHPFQEQRRMATMSAYEKAVRRFFCLMCHSEQQTSGNRIIIMSSFVNLICKLTFVLGTCNGTYMCSNELSTSLLWLMF